jgi:histidinol-phosphate aminotransferase
MTLQRAQDQDLHHHSTAALRHHGDADLMPGLTDLAVNVRAGTPPQWLRDRLAAVDLAAYPDQRAAIAAVAARHHRHPDEVLLTAGAAEAFVLIARALQPRHAVVVHPQFTEPEAALAAAGHRVDRVVLAPPYTLDPQVVPETADLVVIGNPNNPTSVLHRAATLRALVRPGRVVVVDEAFADCVPGEPESLAADPELAGLIVVRSLTKTWGLAGLRAGYVLAAADTVDQLRAGQPLWPVSAPALEACIACSTSDAVADARTWARALTDRRAELQTALTAIDGVTVVPGAAASFLLVHTPRPDVRTRLHQRGFAVRRGETFPGLDESFIRVAVRDAETTHRFARALQEALR